VSFPPSPIPSHPSINFSFPPSRTNFVLTASQDGILKFWKKQAVGVEFVKLYRTHLAPIVHVGVSDDGKSAAVLGADTGGKTAGGNEVKGSAKVFDVENFGGCSIPD